MHTPHPRNTTTSVRAAVTFNRHSPADFKTSKSHCIKKDVQPHFTLRNETYKQHNEHSRFNSQCPNALNFSLIAQEPNN